MTDSGIKNLLVRPQGGWLSDHAHGTLHLGLLNNMADAALESTERQFFRLFGSAAGEHRICWHLFSLRSVARSESGNLHLIHQNYGSPGDLYNTPLDALIVTGTEPVQSDLREEVYWPELSTVFDWIEQEGPPAILSCLAAHAAVLHYDGVERRRLPQKRCGSFDHIRASEHPLTAPLPAPVKVAHSRWNEVPIESLTAAGYEILTFAPEAGADLFAKRRRNTLLFIQGHPEYDADTLAREYRRDVRRYLAGASKEYPRMPRHYFEQHEVEVLEQFGHRALRDRDERLIGEFPPLRPRASGVGSMAPVFGNWLREIDAGRNGRNTNAPRHRALPEMRAP